MNNSETKLAEGTMKRWMYDFIKSKNLEPNSFLKSIGISSTEFNDNELGITTHTKRKILKALNSDFNGLALFIARKIRLKHGIESCSDCIKMLSLSTFFIQLLA